MKRNNVFGLLMCIAIGIFLTAVGVRTAYIERGYYAVGGEWFILPLIITARGLVLEIMEVFCSDE